MERDPGQAEKLAARAGALPVLPQVAFKVFELAADPEVHMGKLEAVLSRDPALAAMILQLCNSAFFGLRSKVTSLSRAIVVLGLDALKSLVIASSAQSLFRSKTSRLKERMLWEHSLAVALTARLLAHELRSADADDAFTAGLLHDIGKTVLDQNLGARYQPVLERVYNEGGRFLEAERDLLGMDHQEVGALVIAKWGLAPTLAEAVGSHHSPLQATIDPALCAVTSLANALAVKLGIGPERLPDLDLASLEAVAILKVDAGALGGIMETVVARLEQEKALLGIA